MKFLTQLKKLSLATIVLSFIVGLLFVAFPAQCIKYISLTLGVIMVAIGIVSIISYFCEKANSFVLAMGIIILITGIVICIKYKAIISLIVVLFGIFILCTGLVDLVTSLKALAIMRVSGLITLVLSVATSVFGIIAITKSTQLTEAIVRFIGFSLLVYAVLDIISYFQVRKLSRNVKNALEDDGVIEAEATIVEETDI